MKTFSTTHNTDTTHPEDADSPESAPSSLGRQVMKVLLSNEFGLLALIVLFFTIFAVATPGFTSDFSLFAMGRTAAVNIVIGFSMMVVIVSGGLNLSVGAIGVCVAMGGGWLMQNAGFYWPFAVAGALALGAIIGALNGFMIVKSGLHSFIITLATMSIFFGVMIFLTQAGSFREISPDYVQFGRMKLGGVISPLLLLALGCGVLLSIFFNFTAAGRGLLAAGANPEAAELSGIRVDRMIILCHSISGVIAGVAGLMLVSRTGAAIPSMAGQLGQDWLLPAFLGPVLGGTLLTGGRASVLGTLLGAFLVTLLTTGLLLLQVGVFWVQTWLGLLLLAAVLIDMLRRSYLVRKNLV
ncbi:MAG: ribose transport system permease protein [Granulosicoccus sp.]|jgi:ribose transport system permease protein